jgi:hypothetical protein
MDALLPLPVLEDNELLRKRLMDGAQLPHVPTEEMVEAGKVARIADFNEHGTTLSPNITQCRSALSRLR